MTLVFHYHPLSSYCWKVLIALYENATPFEPAFLNPGDSESAARFKALWPIGKIPVLEDKARGHVVPETSVILEYLDTFYPGPTPLFPKDADANWRVRLWDRFFDLHIQNHMGAVVFDRLRPADAKDPFGVAQAKEKLATSYGVIERHITGKDWALGEAFSMADCAAAPALFYADKIVPLGDHAQTRAYLERLKARPSFARVLNEAEPFFKYFPQD